MHMSKHHAHALILLGIAVCTGFLLSVPAVASSDQGLQALESGELFLSPFDSLATMGNGSEPSSTLELPVTEDTPDGVTAPADAGSFDVSSGAETVTPAGQENSSVSADPVSVGTSANGTGGYDDERLARLINTAGISLMRLSMEHAHALYLQDADAAAVAADDLHALSIRLLAEVQPLRVSPEQQPVKDEFIRSLSAYTAASETLLNATGEGKEAVSTALGDLDTASEGLETVSQQAVEVQPASAGLPASDAAVQTTEAEVPAVRTGDGPVTVAPPKKHLPVGERYTYDDQQGENMISLLTDSTKTVTSYETTDTNESTMKTEAGDGRTFLLVVVKATNLGHKGDSDLYTIETPGRDEFVLEYQGAAYTPHEAPTFTSLGESFDRKTLDRYESSKGYLYFDVPATLNVSGATLKADLGDAGTPTWDLGRELGNVSAV